MRGKFNPKDNKDNYKSSSVNYNECKPSNEFKNIFKDIISEARISINDYGDNNIIENKQINSDRVSGVINKRNTF